MIRILTLLFLLLSVDLANAVQCTELPIIGNGTPGSLNRFGDPDKTSGDWRPDYPDEVIGSKEKGIPAQNFSAASPIPQNPATGRPLHTTAITCFSDNVKLPPGLSRVTTSDAKIELQRREPRLDVSTIDKAPAPKSRVKESRNRSIESWKRLARNISNFIIAVAYAATATDLFNRPSDADLGTDWTPGTDDSCKIVSDSQVFQTAGSVTCWETYNALVPGGSQYGKITLGDTVGSSPGDSVAVSLRTATAADQMYICAAEISGGSSTTRIRVRNSGGTTLYTENATTWATGDTLEFRATGSALDCLRNGSTLLSGTDATWSTGRVGIFLVGGGGVFGIDDIELGDFGAAGVARGKITMVQ